MIIFQINSIDLLCFKFYFQFILYYALKSQNIRQGLSLEAKGVSVILLAKIVEKILTK